jgi:integrase
MGTVYKRGKTFWIQYFDKGRKINDSTGTSDEAEARRQLRVKLGEVASGKCVVARRATIGDLCDLVKENHRQRELSRTKIVGYVVDANIHRLLGRLVASRFGSAQINQYILRRQQEGASNATINRELAIVARNFKLGYQAEPKLVLQMPVIPKLPESSARQGFLEPDQYERVLEELPAKLKAPFVCGYHTGARKGELRSIRWSQVDFEAGLIRLPAEQTKNRRPRTLPIYGDMQRWVKHQLETCPAGCVWVFHGAHGRPVDSHLNGWREACKATTPHPHSSRSAKYSGPADIDLRGFAIVKEAWSYTLSNSILRSARWRI